AMFLELLAARAARIFDPTVISGYWVLNQFMPRLNLSQKNLQDGLVAGNPKPNDPANTPDHNYSNPDEIKGTDYIFPDWRFSRKRSTS
ncbi:MAG: hypothetical protein V7727_21440, partial [Sneathiella sp.]